jgi:tripartite-type tricarboxylate transporter receptor subunit TctC
MRPVDWNPLVDLQPIIQVSGTTFGLLVPADSPWRHPHELIEWGRRHPGELKLGSTGVGSTPHLAMEEILSGFGIPYIHVPYKGTADQMLAIASGQLMAGVNSTGFAPWAEQGKIRVLAVFSERRSALWPDAPTMKEAGFPQAVYTSPWGFSAPRGTPVALVQRWHDLMREAIHAPAHVEALARYDQHLEYLNTQAYEQAILQTVERERNLLRRMNLLHKGHERPT